MPSLEGKTGDRHRRVERDRRGDGRRDPREGVRVAGGARRVDQIDADVALELDVTDPESCERFVAEAVAELGGVDILVNAAGLALGRDPFWESTEEDERDRARDERRTA